MEILIIIALIVAGIILFLVEVMIIPGISVAGFLAGVCLVGANYYAFWQLGTVPGLITLAISLVLCVFAFLWVMKSKSFDRLALKKNIDSTVATPEQKQVKAGDTGITVTRLTLIGNAEINGNIVEVKSNDGFLDEKTPIVVEKILENVIIVKKL